MTTSTIIWGVLLATVLALCFQLSIASSRASFRESCNKQVRCNSRDYLTCSPNGLCECLIEDSMIYDENIGKCVALAGENCQLTTVKGDNTYVTTLPCVSGSTCSGGFCECLRGYFEASNGFCSAKKRYHENCTSDDMCGENLVCGKDKLCICDSEGGLTYEDNHCKVLSGHRCDSENTMCINGAKCESRSQVCACSEDYYLVASGRCTPKRNRGETCASDMECLDTVLGRPTFLTCFEGHCQCDSEHFLDQTLKESNVCVKPLGDSCDQNNCIEGAICNDGRCQCQESSHFETKEKLCERRRTYNESCETNRECLGSFKCDYTTKKCLCGTGESFVPYLNKCAISVGSVCALIGDRCNDCVPNTNTKRSRDFIGICECKWGFEASLNGDGLCYASFDMECNGDSFGPPSSKLCLPGLICRDGKCKCMYGNHQGFNSTSQTCRSGVKGPCSKTSDCGHSRTECVEQNGLKTCQCKEGTHQVDRDCQQSILSYGDKCDPGSKAPGCDQVAGLECTSNGVCSCPLLQRFNTKENACFGGVGEKCSVCPVTTWSNAVACGEGLFCKPNRGMFKSQGICTCLPGWTSTPDRQCKSNDANLVSASSAKDLMSNDDL